MEQDLLNYGVLGISTLFLGRFAWYAYQDLKKDRDTWRAAYEKELEARLEDRQALVALTEMGKTTVALLQTIRDERRGNSPQA